METFKVKQTKSITLLDDGGGMTKKIFPSKGLTQGAQDSPQKSLIALIIWQHAVAAWLRENDNIQRESSEDFDICSRVRLSLLSYADDGVIFVRWGKLQELCNFLTKLGAITGVSIKHEKCAFYTWDNEPLDTEVSLETWSWKTGTYIERKHKIQGAYESKWKILGVCTGGIPTATTHEDYIVEKQEKCLNKLGARRLDIHEITPCLEALWSSLATHGTLAHARTLESLIQMDNGRNVMVRRTIKLSTRTPCDLFGASEKVGGLNIPSAIAGRAQDLARELFV